MAFDYMTLARPDLVPDPRTPLIGLGDPLPAPTGFARVLRGLFRRIPQEKFRLAYLSRGWVGSGRFPGVQCYSDGNRPGMCQEALPDAAMDFCWEDGIGLRPFILLTLSDPWQMSWLSRPETSPHRRPASVAFLKAHRKQMCWVGHFPIDGEGPTGGPARWTEQHLEGMDVPVAMSTWGRDLCQPLVEQEIRMIPHAVDVNTIKPLAQKEARANLDASYLLGVALASGAMGPDGKIAGSRELAEEVQHRAFRLGDRFTVLCIMANRERKYWWDALRAFKILLDDIPDARFIGLCGDRHGVALDSWPLEDCCRDLGLRLDVLDDEPNVTLLETYTDRPDAPEDHSLRTLINAADTLLLPSGGEGSGLPQLEAHACGRPCLVGKYSASIEQAVDDREFFHPRNFYFTPHNMVKRPIYSPKDIADRLRYAARNPGWRAEVGAKGIEQANARSWEKIMPQWIALFEEAASRLDQKEGSSGPEAPAPQVPA